MASTNKLYPPIINGVIPAFYKRKWKKGDGKKWTIARIAIPFAMNQMVSKTAIKTMCLRLKTVQTNRVVYLGATKNFDLNEGIAYFDLQAEWPSDPETDAFDTSDYSVLQTSSAKNDAKQLTPGLFYKAQLAYSTSENVGTENININEVGYFSSVGVIKCVSKPTVSIANFDNMAINLAATRYLGKYEQDYENGDSTEKVYSYSFVITDSQGQEYISSGTQLHNINNDIDYWKSEDEFIVHKDLVKGELYYIQYSITTVNNLSVSSPQYRIMVGESVSMEKPIEVLPELNYDEGYIQINFRGPIRYEVNTTAQTLQRYSEDVCSGLYLLQRGHLQDDYMVWEDIARFKLNNIRPSTHYERDFTIEQGITYKYRLQEYNYHGIYSKPIESKEIYADFEDMFLYDGIRQLKVRFNPKVSTFKVDIPEQKVETIGSKYPFIFRNGSVYYHEFPISGLISYQLDEAKLFLTGEEIIDGNLLEPDMSYRYPYLDAQGRITYFNDTDTTQVSEGVVNAFNSAREVVSTPHYDNNSKPIKSDWQIRPTNEVRKDKDLTSENMMSERYFKLAVLKWLTNGEIKLFRSPGEGNYLVRLLNTSMTPNDTLGRMLHTFNTTAYEIADLTYDNLLQYSLISVTEPSELATHVATSPIAVSYDSTTGEPNESLVYIQDGDQQLTNFSIDDCMPGDKIRIVFADDDSEVTIVIGVTGSYSYSPINRPIKEIYFTPTPAPQTTYPRAITITYPGVEENYFDLVTKISSVTEVARRYYGPTTDLINSVPGDLNNYFKLNIKLGYTDSSYKTQLLDLEMLRVTAREIIPLYCWKNNNNELIYNTTPFGVGYPLAELQELLNTAPYYTRNARIGSFAIYKVYEYDGSNNSQAYIKPEIINNVRPEAAHILNSADWPTQKDTENDEYDDDFIYAEKYLDWKFVYYWDPQRAENEWIISTDEENGPDMRFSINSDATTGEYQYIDLAHQHEITLWHLGQPDFLWLGNGVMAEIVARIRVTNYSIEDTNMLLSSDRETYLNLKQKLIEDYEAYALAYPTEAAAYNAYVVALENYQTAVVEYAKLDEALQVLEALLQDTSIYDNEIASLTTAAITAINAYNDVMYAAFTTITGEEQLPPAFSIASKPAAVASSVTGTDNLLAALENFHEFYINALNDFSASIPDIADIDLPEGWTDLSIEEIITIIKERLVTYFAELYLLLRYSNVVVNPFTDTYFADYPSDGNWSTTDYDNILALQDTIGGVEEISFESIFPDDAIDTNASYHYDSKILQDRRDYRNAVNAYNVAIGNTEDATGAVLVAQSAYDDLANLVEERRTANQAQIAIQEAERTKISTYNALIAGLESEEQTEGTIAAINFLRKSIEISEGKINAAQTIIDVNNEWIAAFQTTPEFIEADTNLTNAQNALAAYEAAEETAYRVVNTMSAQLNNDIALWNNDFTMVTNYLSILLQIEELLRSSTDVESLNLSIRAYQLKYHNLVTLQDAEYIKATASIQEVVDVDLAFESMINLQTEWNLQLGTLRAIKEQGEPSPVDPPDEFQWAIRLKQLKDAWARFMMDLEDVYSSFESRYY